MLIPRKFVGSNSNLDDCEGNAVVHSTDNNRRESSIRNNNKGFFSIWGFILTVGKAVFTVFSINLILTHFNYSISILAYSI